MKRGLELFLADSLQDDTELEALLLRSRSLQMRTRNYLTTKALPYTQLSAWASLDAHGDDADFIAALSLDRASFDHLCEGFSRHITFRSNAITGGRPPKLDSKSILSLVLHFYIGAFEQKSLFQLWNTTCISTRTHRRISIA